MSDGRAVVDDEHALAGDGVWIVESHDGGRAHHGRVRREAACRLGHPMDIDLGRRIRLGHDDDVRHAQDGLARMMRGLMSGPQRVDQDDIEIGPHEREIVVAAIPDDDVRLRLGQARMRP